MISLIFPTFNEAENLEELYKQNSNSCHLLWKDVHLLPFTHPKVITEQENFTLDPNKFYP